MKKTVPRPPVDAQPENVELLIQDINRRIEALKVQFNLFFAGETRVPPDKEREELEKLIRNLIGSSRRAPRIDLLLQNLASRFSLYNNMWLKRLNEIESGSLTLPKGKTAVKERKPAAPKGKTVEVSLNNEDSFETFFDHYARIVPSGTVSSQDKDKIINSIKYKMITANLIDAKINLSVDDGKIKIKIKN
ncbi:MAG: hypothetical protein ACM3SY_16300 [Candidatus Omnitrophota bacterium]